MSEKQKGYSLVVLSGLFWATTGLFANRLMIKNITPEQVAFIRLFLGFFILFIYSAIKDIRLLKINKRIFIHCFMIGLICQAGFNLCYFKAVESLGVSMAAILLYTSPLFLAIMSKLVYKENLGVKKIISLIICFIGSILAVTSTSLEGVSISSTGIILGILAAITYASMSIISKGILCECSGITILIYGFLIGSILMIPISKPWEIISHIDDTSTLMPILGLGFISASGGYICYIKGISKGIDLSIAGILATGELIGSVIIGWVLLGESFSLINSLGIVLMIISGVISVIKIGNNKLETLYGDIELTIEQED